MRLFKNFEYQVSSMKQSHDSPQSKSKKTRAPKDQISASEIRSKVKEHFTPKPKEDKVEVDKVEVSKLAQQKKQKEVASEEVEENEKEKVASDVGLNDPSDPATVEKLKSVLTKGAFNFNPAERETLEKILSARD